jgi:quercetin dioxygenase-like cupin family protein
MSVFPDVSARALKQLAEGVTTRTFWGENLLLSYVEIEAGASVPRHSHVHEQAGVVLQGRLTLIVGEEQKDLQPGDIFLIPSNVPHEVPATTERVLVLDVFSPIREDLKYA